MAIELGIQRVIQKMLKPRAHKQVFGLIVRLTVAVDEQKTRLAHGRFTDAQLTTHVVIEHKVCVQLNQASAVGVLGVLGLPNSCPPRFDVLKRTVERGLHQLKELLLLNVGKHARHTALFGGVTDARDIRVALARVLAM